MEEYFISIIRSAKIKASRDNTDEVEESAKAITNITTKFMEWIRIDGIVQSYNNSNNWVFYDETGWAIECTDEELFNYFITNIYKR